MRILNLLILLALGLMVIYSDHPALVMMFQDLSQNPDEVRSIIYAAAGVLGAIFLVTFSLMMSKTRKEKRKVAQDDAQRLDDFRRSVRVK